MTSLNEGGAAANAGLYPDDIILQIDYQPVKSAKQFVELANQLPGGKAVPLLVKRESETLYVAVRTPPDATPANPTTIPTTTAPAPAANAPK